jgi:hypothetical protein
LGEVAFANREYVSTKCAADVVSGWSIFFFKKKETQAGGFAVISEVKGLFASKCCTCRHGTFTGHREGHFSLAPLKARGNCYGTCVRLFQDDFAGGLETSRLVRDRPTTARENLFVSSKFCVGQKSNSPVAYATRAAGGW